MMGVSEKIAYLKGLIEGLKIDESSDEGKVFHAIADVLSEIALELDDLTDEVREISDGLDVVSDDLEDVETLLYDDFDDDDDEPFYATTCPECGEEVVFDESDLEDGKLACPNCGASLEFDAEDLAAADEEDEDGE